MALAVDLLSEVLESGRMRERRNFLQERVLRCGGNLERKVTIISVFIIITEFL